MAVSWEQFDALGLESPFAGERDERELVAFAPAGESPFAFGETDLAGFDEAGFDEAGFGQSGFDEAEVAFEEERFPSGLILNPTTGPTGPGQQHYDPTTQKPRLPLLATPPSTHGQKLSANFTVKELISSGGRPSPVARISPELVRVLQAIRDHAGKPVRVTSGYRSFTRNKDVYKGYGKDATKSQHSAGKAADIVISGISSGLEMAKLAIDAAGTELAIGIGAKDVHVDVRGEFTVWTYLKEPANSQAKAALRAHRNAVLRSRAPLPAPPRPAPVPRPSGAASGRDTVNFHPLLRSHGGASPDLIFRWANITGPGPVDVIVHFHGHSPLQTAMRLDKHKEGKSGVDLSGRMRPTLALIPRGKFTGGSKGARFEFPALLGPGALAAFIADGLARLSARTGYPHIPGRLILTCHSGGGKAIAALLPHTPADEVHTYDALYQPATGLETWAKRVIAADLAAPAGIPPAMRVLYTTKGGTVTHSTNLAKAMRGAVPSGSRLESYFRVEWVPAEHDDVPRMFGPLLLADGGATISSARLAREAEDESASDQRSESLAWLDPTAEVGESWSGEALGETLAEPIPAEALDPSSSSLNWGEDEGPGNIALESAGEGLDALGQGPLSEGAEAFGAPSDEGFEGYEPEGAGPLGEGLDTLDEGPWAGTGEALGGPLGEGFDAYDTASEDLDAFDPSAEGPLGEEEGSLGEGLDASGEAGEEETAEAMAEFESEGLYETEWHEAGTAAPTSGFDASLDERAWLEQTFAAELEHETGASTGVLSRVTGLAALMLGPTLRRGAKGAAVAALQRALNAQGATLVDDGDFGSKTEAAVRAFQTSRGLSPDGIVGPQTKAALASGGARPAPTPIPPSPGPSPLTTGTCIATAALAMREYDLWHPPSGRGLKEDQPAAWPHLTRYWRDGLGVPVTPAQLGDAAWQQSRPWSSAFICYVMRTAGSPGFVVDPYHHGYVAAAKRNRMNNDRANPYWAYRPTEIAPRVGDIISWERGNSGISYDNVHVTKPKRKSHGDIVVEVRPGIVVTIGGNVQNDVGRKELRTLPDGRIDPNHRDQRRIYAIVSCRGASAGVVTPDPPRPIPPTPPTPPTPPAPVPHTGEPLSTTEFIRKYGPYARDSEARTRIPALVTLAQAAVESGWGAKAGGNNAFGVKASLKSPPETRQRWLTKEDSSRPDAYKDYVERVQLPNGMYRFSVYQWFRVYPTLKASFDDHDRILLLPRYARAFAVLPDAYAFAAEVHKARYATAWNYTQVLHSVMRRLQRAGF